MTTVAELIKALSTLPPESFVYVESVSDECISSGSLKAVQTETDDDTGEIVVYLTDEGGL